MAGPELPRKEIIPIQQPVGLRRREALAAINTEVETAIRSVMPSAVSVVTFVPEYEPLLDRPEPRARIFGAGFVIKSAEDEVVIATNKHAVQESQENSRYSLRIQTSAVAPDMSDREKKLFTDAKVVYISKDADIAFVSIDPKEHPNIELPEVTFGSSTNLKSGHSIAAIGSPHAATFTVSVGTIAHDKYRDLDSDIGRNTFIQIDAAIRPGNSGGMAIDLETDPAVVIGMPTGGIADAATGFAIPAEIIAEEFAKYQEQKNEAIVINPTETSPNQQSILPLAIEIH